MSAQAEAVPAVPAGALRTLLKLLLALFVISCVFDPADLILGLKVPLFLACWAVTILGLIMRGAQVAVPRAALLYVLLFVAVPFASIASYFAQDGGAPFEGFMLLKGYALVSLAALLYLNRIDLLPTLSAILIPLAVLILGVGVAIAIQPELFTLLRIPGTATGILFLDRRDYGAGLVMLQVYFVTSPMLVAAIAHYFDRSRRSALRAQRVRAVLLLLLCAVAMVVAGTRNNLVVALLLPLGLMLMHGRSRILGVVVCGTVLVLMAGAFLEQIATLLDPTEFSNLTKLSLLDDYAETLSDPRALLGGTGLGAYQFWTAKGIDFFVSELTFLEMIRNFGLLGGLVMLGLLLYPLIAVFVLRRAQTQRSFALAYALYLVMCFTNPNLFSSMGILILSILLANIWMAERAPQPRASERGGMAAAGAAA